MNTFYPSNSSKIRPRVKSLTSNLSTIQQSKDLKQRQKKPMKMVRKQAKKQLKTLPTVSPINCKCSLLDLRQHHQVMQILSTYSKLSKQKNESLSSQT